MLIFFLRTCSAFQLSILSEVRLLNFLRWCDPCGWPFNVSYVWFFRCPDLDFIGNTKVQQNGRCFYVFVILRGEGKCVGEIWNDIVKRYWGTNPTTKNTQTLQGTKRDTFVTPQNGGMVEVFDAFGNAPGLFKAPNTWFSNWRTTPWMLLMSACCEMNAAYIRYRKYWKKDTIRNTDSVDRLKNKNSYVWRWPRRHEFLGNTFPCYSSWKETHGVEQLEGSLWSM